MKKYDNNPIKSNTTAPSLAEFFGGNGDFMFDQMCGKRSSNSHEDWLVRSGDGASFDHTSHTPGYEWTGYDARLKRKDGGSVETKSSKSSGGYPYGSVDPDNLAYLKSFKKGR